MSLRRSSNEADANFPIVAVRIYRSSLGGKSGAYGVRGALKKYRSDFANLNLFHYKVNI